MALTGKTISELDLLQFPTNDTAIPVEYNGDTLRINFSAITYNEGTYSQFVTEANNGLLTPGRCYLMTDFQTCYDQPNYDSSGDEILVGNYKTGTTEPILLLAISTTEFSPTVYSPLYPQDKISYDITWNLTEITSGPAKGRITERIDERNNRTDYDFRAVQFIRYQGFYSESVFQGKVSIDPAGLIIGVGTSFVSQFTNGDIIGIKDNNFSSSISCFSYYEVVSIADDLNMVVTGTTITSANNVYYSNGQFLSNYMNPHQCNVPSLTASAQYYTFNNNDSYNTYIGDNNSNNTFILSNNVFLGGSYRDNFFGGDCIGNTFNDDMDSNTAGAGFQFNIITNDFDENTIGPDFQRNIIEVDFRRNTISDGFERNMIGDDDGSDFNDNVIGGNFGSNFFTMSDVFEYNNIGNGFNNNIIDDEFDYNQIIGDFNNNFISDRFDNNQIGLFFNGNTILSSFENNVIGDDYFTNINRNQISDNVFGNGCNNNTFGTTGYSATIQGNRLGNNFDDNTIFTDFTSNEIGNDFHMNNIYSVFIQNVVGANGYNNVIGDSDSLGSYSFGRNTIGSNMNNNGFSGNTEFNTIGHYFEENNVDTNFSFNKIGNYFITNTIANDFGFGGGVSRGNTIGNYFENNTIGEYFYDNQVSDLFYGNTTGDYFQLNNISAYNVYSTDFTVNYGNINSITYVATGSTAENGTFTGVTGDTSSPTGFGGTFNISIVSGEVTSVGPSQTGRLYNTGELITILGTSIGGTTPEDDVVITVDSISPTPVVYTSTNANIVKNSSGQYKLYYLGGSGIEFVDVTSPFD